MLNRRSILACLGFLPATLSAKRATFVGEPSAPIDHLSVTSASAVQLTPSLQDLVRTFDPALGNLGRGHRLPIDTILRLQSDLIKAGFGRYRTPCKGGWAVELIPVYDTDGRPCAGVWFGFIRQNRNAREVVAFECDYVECERFTERTGKTLSTALARAMKGTESL